MLLAKVIPQADQQFPPVLRSLLAPLLMLDDSTSDLPVSRRQHRIDGLGGRAPGLLQKTGYVRQKPAILTMQTQVCKSFTGHNLRDPHTALELAP